MALTNLTILGLRIFYFDVILIIHDISPVLWLRAKRAVRTHITYCAEEDAELSPFRNHCLHRN
jgi:hypothetical protein